MIRFILKRKSKYDTNGLETEGLYTVYLDVPELENKLNRGGVSECGYEIHELIGCEIVNDHN